MDREKSSARRISSEDGYRELFNYLGSSENAEFARIAKARRIIFFEGKDRKIVRRIAAKVDDTQLIESPDTAFFQAGGFSQWGRIQNVDWTLENMFKIDAKISSIFDRDYRCDEEIDEFVGKMNSERMICHVLDRKEIENYAIELEPLKRLIVKKLSERGVTSTPDEAGAIIDDVCATLRADVQARRAASYLAHHRARFPNVDDSTHLKAANALFEADWASFDGRKKLIPGKIFFSELSKRLQSDYGAGVTIAQAIGEMRKSEVSDFIVNVLKDIERFFAT